MAAMKLGLDNKKLALLTSLLKHYPHINDNRAVFRDLYSKHAHEFLVFLDSADISNATYSTLLFIAEVQERMKACYELAAHGALLFAASYAEECMGVELQQRERTYVSALTYGLPLKSREACVGLWKLTLRLLHAWSAHSFEFTLFRNDIIDALLALSCITMDICMTVYAKVDEPVRTDVFGNDVAATRAQNRFLVVCEQYIRSLLIEHYAVNNIAVGYFVNVRSEVRAAFISNLLPSLCNITRVLDWVSRRVCFCNSWVTPTHSYVRRFANRRFVESKIKAVHGLNMSKFSLDDYSRTGASYWNAGYQGNSSASVIYDYVSRVFSGEDFCIDLSLEAELEMLIKLFMYDCSTDPGLAFLPYDFYIEDTVLPACTAKSQILVFVCGRRHLIRESVVLPSRSVVDAWIEWCISMRAGGDTSVASALNWMSTSDGTP